jgi:hypothetical protein
MLDYARELYEELLCALRIANEDSQSNRVPPANCLQLLIEAIDKLRNRLKDYHFERKDEEIVFYKSVMPDILAEAIYYEEKFGIEVIKHGGSPKLLYICYDRLFNNIEQFFHENREFFFYYHSGNTIFDQYYYLRSSAFNKPYTEMLAFLLDTSFCTSHSVKIARMIAYNRLEKEIHTECSGEKEKPSVPLPDQERLEWTDSQAAIVELMYALKEQGSFNNGKASIKAIASGFEKAFQKPIDNPYRTFQEIMRRKGGQKKFIDTLGDKILDAIIRVENEKKLSGRRKG